MTTNRITLSEYWSLRYSAGGSPVTQVMSQRIGAVCAWALGSAGFSPSVVTLIGSGVFISGAVLYVSLPSSIYNTLILLILFQLGYGLDCADGQLARATRRTSEFGAWLDVACDYLRNSFLALALLCRLVQVEFDMVWAFVAAALLLSGTAMKLHTHTVMRGVVGDADVLGPRMDFLRRSAKIGLDTATHLLILTLLRDWPALLAAYGACIGCAYGGLAVAQARKRLPG